MHQQHKNTDHDMTAAGFAHAVAPAPDGHAHLDGQQPAVDLPVVLARNHIARAYGFYLGAETGDWVHGMSMMLAEYQLALTWMHIAASGQHLDGPGLAAELVTDLVSPHVIGPNLLSMLEWAGIGPAQIRPYGPSGRVRAGVEAEESRS